MKAELAFGLGWFESETEVDVEAPKLVVKGLIGRTDQPLKKPLRPLEQRQRQRDEGPWARLEKFP